MKCNHKGKKSLQPTFKQLIFGGFNVKMEMRCNKCERKICKLITKMLKERNKVSYET